MKSILALVLVSLLAACGGGGSDADPPNGVSCAERPIACQ